jgi:hypothetical protein
MRRAMSAYGTNAKCRNVRFRAAVRVIAEVAQTSFEDGCWTRLGHERDLKRDAHAKTRRWRQQRREHAP